LKECSNPECGLTRVDTDSMYKTSYIRIKGDIVTKPYSEMTCKVCGWVLK
jgi:rubredoxin